MEKAVLNMCIIYLSYWLLLDRYNLSEVLDILKDGRRKEAFESHMIKWQLFIVLCKANFRKIAPNLKAIHVITLFAVYELRILQLKLVYI